MRFWSHFGRVLWRVWKGFWALMNRFQGFQDVSNFEGEVGSRKSGSKVMKGVSGYGYGGPNIGE